MLFPRYLRMRPSPNLKLCGAALCTHFCGQNKSKRFGVRSTASQCTLVLTHMRPGTKCATSVQRQRRVEVVGVFAL
eukprot:3069421-Amphidinium_carterae.1